MHARDILSGHGTPGCVCMQNSVQNMHKIPAHMCIHLITDAQVTHARCLAIHEVYMQAHQQACLITSAHAQRAEGCVYSHSMHVHVHTDYAYLNIHILEGEGKSYVSWDYIPGRCQETPAGGFYITMLLLIEMCDHFCFSWLPNTKAVRAYWGHVPVNLFC